MDTKHYGYLGREEDLDETFYIRKGQVVSGYTIGILLLDTWYPLVPGNVVSACTFNFPVLPKMIPGGLQERVHRGDPTILDDLIKAGRELELNGVRAIVGACGYLGNYQQAAAAAFNVPTYLSSMIQIPFIKTGLKPDERIGVLCADGHSLTPALLKKVGVDDSSICVIAGIGDEPEFSAILRSDRGHFDNKKVRQEVVGAAVKLVQENEKIGAILLECSDMPPYAAAVQRAVNLPVFDFTTMINWVHQSVSQKPYYGFV
jgi:hypothetical protein